MLIKLDYRLHTFRICKLNTAKYNIVITGAQLTWVMLLSLNCLARAEDINWGLVSLKLEVRLKFGFLG